MNILFPAAIIVFITVISCSFGPTESRIWLPFLLLEKIITWLLQSADCITFWLNLNLNKENTGIKICILYNVYVKINYTVRIGSWNVVSRWWSGWLTTYETTTFSSKLRVFWFCKISSLNETWHKRFCNSNNRIYPILLSPEDGEWSLKEASLGSLECNPLTLPSLLHRLSHFLSRNNETFISLGFGVLNIVRFSRHRALIEKICKIIKLSKYKIIINDHFYTYLLNKCKTTHMIMNIRHMTLRTIIIVGSVFTCEFGCSTTIKIYLYSFFPVFQPIKAAAL